MKRKRRSWLELSLHEIEARGIKGCVRLDNVLTLHREDCPFLWSRTPCLKLTDLSVADLKASARIRRRRR